MKVNVLLFGKFRDITGCDQLVIDGVSDTEQLLQTMYDRYPEMTSSKCLVAVDRTVVSKKTILENNNTVALMPPFSGG